MEDTTAPITRGGGSKKRVSEGGSSDGTKESKRARSSPRKMEQLAKEDAENKDAEKRARKSEQDRVRREKNKVEEEERKKKRERDDRLRGSTRRGTDSSGSGIGSTRKDGRGRSLVASQRDGGTSSKGSTRR